MTWYKPGRSFRTLDPLLTPSGRGSLCPPEPKRNRGRGKNCPLFTQRHRCFILRSSLKTKSNSTHPCPMFETTAVGKSPTGTWHGEIRSRTALCRPSTDAPASPTHRERSDLSSRGVEPPSGAQTCPRASGDGAPGWPSDTQALNKSRSALANAPRCQDTTLRRYAKAASSALFSETVATDSL